MAKRRFHSSRGKATEATGSCSVKKRSFCSILLSRLAAVRDQSVAILRKGMSCWSAKSVSETRRFCDLRRTPAECDVTMQRAPRYLQGCANIIHADRLIAKQLVRQHDPGSIDIYWRPTTLTAPCASGSESGLCPFLNKPTLELCECGENKEDEFTGWRRRIDSTIADGTESDASVTKLVDHRDQVTNRSSQSVKSPDE